MSPRKTETSGKSVKPATAAAAGKTAAAKPRSASPPPAGARARPGKAVAVDPAYRRRLIAEAAYYKAERRGFAGDGALADWIEAETEIDALLNWRGGE